MTGPGLTWQENRMALRQMQPWESNPKNSTAEDAAQLVKSKEALGQFQTIAVGPDGEVYDGHQRLTAWLDQYGPDYEVIVLQSSRALTQAEREDIALASRQTGRWDWGKLEGWNKEKLTGWGFGDDMAAMWQKDAAKLGEMKEPTSQGEDTAPQVDKAAELQEKWGTELGQMWALGDHRIICGDCTDPAVVGRLMGEERAELCVTSPPYSVGKDYESADINDWIDLIDGLFRIMPSSNVWINLANKRTGNDGYERNTFFELCQLVSRYNYKMIGLRIWVKDPAWAGQSPYWRHTYKPVDEFEFVGLFSCEKPKYKNRLRDSDNNAWGYRGVWSFQSVSKNKLHSAAYPIELPDRCMRMMSDNNDIIFDPFLGSGTTLIAAEQLNRQCRGVEIEPKYVAVTLQRYLDHTGQQPERLI